MNKLEYVIWVSSLLQTGERQSIDHYIFYVPYYLNKYY